MDIPFPVEQGVQVSEMILYHDNMSSILLEKHCYHSSTKHTKHMEIRHFNVTDQVWNKLVSIKHCPMEERIGHYFMKPLQGSLFIKMRDYIMQTTLEEHDAPSGNPDQEHRSVLEIDDEHANHSEVKDDEHANHSEVNEEKVVSANESEQKNQTDSPRSYWEDLMSNQTGSSQTLSTKI